MGEGVFGRGAARGATQASKAAQGREEDSCREGHGQEVGGQEAGCEEEIDRAEEGAEKEVLILRSALFARVSKDGRGRIMASWFETREAALLTMRVCFQATWLRVSATYSGSASQMTRLRPLRLAA